MMSLDQRTALGTVDHSSAWHSHARARYLRVVASSRSALVQGSWRNAIVHARPDLGPVLLLSRAWRPDLSSKTSRSDSYWTTSADISWMSASSGGLLVDPDQQFFECLLDRVVVVLACATFS